MLNNWKNFDAMTNGNENISPEFMQDIKAVNDGRKNVFNYVPSGGLTKREYFAAIFHAALLGRGEFGYSNPDGNAEQAVIEADALIAQLNTIKKAS